MRLAGKGLLSSALWLAGVVCSGTAAAQEFDRSGVYVAVAGTGAFEQFENTGPIDADDSLGFNLRAGVRAHPRLAGELEFEWMDGFDLSYYGFGSSQQVDMWTLTANLKGYFLTGRFQPFALLGAGVMQAEITQHETDFAARFGGGVEGYLTEHVVLALGADYVLPTGDVDDLDYVSLSWGLQYRF